MKNSENKLFDAIIVGAGMSGLIAARRLAGAGLKIIVLDKGRGVGGRMATRFADDLRFDHGAQALNAGSAEFSAMLDKWSDEGILKPGPNPHPGDKNDNEGNYYHVPGGISRLPEYLADGLNIKTSCRVSRITRHENYWRVDTSGHEYLHADKLLMTPPAPQCLELLAASEIDLPRRIRDDLSMIEYESCIALLMRGKAVNNRQIYAAPPEAPVSLIVDNYRKGVSPKPEAYTVHMNRKFSEENWLVPDEKLIESILAACRERVEYIEGYLKIHRWRYSRTVRSHPRSFIMTEQPGIMAFAGDGFSGEDIEGAAISGLDAAEALISNSRR